MSVVVSNCFCLVRVNLGPIALLDYVVDGRTTGEGEDSEDVLRSGKLPSWRSFVSLL